MIVSFQKRFRRPGWKSHHEAVVRVRQVHGQIVRLALHPGDLHQAFAKVRLRIPRRMRQRHEHLPLAHLPQPHVVLHDGVAACIAVLVPQPLEDPLGRVPLLLAAHLPASTSECKFAADSSRRV